MRRIRPTTKQIIKLTTEEIFSTLEDFLSVPFFSSSNLYSASLEKVLRNQEIRRSDFSKQIYELKRRGYICDFVHNKEKFIELTPKCLARISKSAIAPVARPVIWDTKWRVVMFDIPEKRKTARDAFRRKIVSLGFEQTQKSVYVHPFECAVQIKSLASSLDVSKYVTIMISEIIEGEEKLIEHFFNTKLLNKSDLK